MGSVIDLKPLLAKHNPPDEAKENIWSCGQCSAVTWTLERCGLVRCSACGARASNIFVADIEAEDRSQR